MAETSFIFLSHKTEDREKIRPLAEAIKILGWEIWWSPQIPPGESWLQVIGAQLEASKCVVAVWTPRSVSAEWVRAEVQYAYENKKLVPVILEECRIGWPFSQIEAVNLIEWNGDIQHEEFQLLIEKIRRIAGEPREKNVQALASEVIAQPVEQPIGQKASAEPLPSPAKAEPVPRNTSTPSASSSSFGHTLIGIVVLLSILLAIAGVIKGAYDFAVNRIPSWFQPKPSPTIIIKPTPTPFLFPTPVRGLGSLTASPTPSPTVRPLSDLLKSIPTPTPTPSRPLSDLLKSLPTPTPSPGKR